VKNEAVKNTRKSIVTVKHIAYIYMKIRTKRTVFLISHLSDLHCEGTSE